MQQCGTVSHAVIVGVIVHLRLLCTILLYKYSYRLMLVQRVWQMLQIVHVSRSCHLCQSYISSL